MNTTARPALLRRGSALEYATLGWNVVGIVVLAVAAIAALKERPSWQRGIAASDGAHPAAAGDEQLSHIVAGPWRRWLDDPRRGGSPVRR
ncbi:hypothetical protein [Frankia sp. AgKG'84/4]|uniref:hypothetical protein n=1 Tax=Frankia sp. AgKG'84/4 TaxID=573490 RepID=UPI00202A4A9F|nr:hypothetical protein [Frankia sp. AgKG'84/4]MCL9796860.1 hypothetical protein [Frankia sp. AgKG'84/4]